MASLIAIVSGLLMSVQGVWNTRIKDSCGIWCANTIVQGVGFIFSLIILLIVRDANFTGIKNINKIYLLSGVLGVGIVYAVIKAISGLGPARATMLILISQILGAYAIELLGLFGTDKVNFEWNKLTGVLVMIAGILIFQWHR